MTPERKIVAGVYYGGGVLGSPLGAVIMVEVGVRRKIGWDNIAEARFRHTEFARFFRQLQAWHRKVTFAQVWCNTPKVAGALFGMGLPAQHNKLEDVGLLLQTFTAEDQAGRWHLDPKMCPHLAREYVRGGEPHAKLAVGLYLLGEGAGPDSVAPGIPLELQPTLYRGPDGRIYDNPNATQAQRRMRALGGDWMEPRDWIDKVQVDDDATHLKKVWRMLTGKELELPE